MIFLYQKDEEKHHAINNEQKQKIENQSHGPDH